MVNKKSKSYQLFPNFYDHPFIQRLAEIPKWSISRCDKVPIDMLALSKGQIKGCVPTDPYSMDTLDNTIKIMETNYQAVPNNHAFLMNIDEDQCIMLDIEPTCPSSLKRKFMQIPHIYAEKSLSGKGIHIFLPVPDEYYNYPQLRKIQKMQDKNRHYEIMFDHWVTFTRNQLHITNTTDDTFFKQIFKELAEAQVVYENEKIDFELNYNPSETISEIPGADEILEIALNPNANKFNKTADDYNGDLSRYIFAICAHYYKIMDRLMSASFVKEKHPDNFTPQEQTRILYEIIKDRVPKRDKNNERRNGTTWLMDQCRKCVSIRIGEKN